LIDHLGHVQSLQQAFAALSDVQRRVLELAYHEELSQPEIAERTGLPLGTVKSHARRGLAALRQALPNGKDAP
jgi:RNA polymerase sigma-70 factor (ECF subfamily)